MGLKILVFTTAFQRERTTTIHMNWMNDFVHLVKDKHDVQLIPLYVLSSFDPLRTYFKELLQGHGFDFVVTESEKLSSKAQSGFDVAKLKSFDYFMHLDSDEFITEHLIEKWIQQIQRGEKWIACRDQMYYVPEEQMYYMSAYKRMKYVNAGNCIHRELLEKISWKLWTPGLDFGLNHNEYKHLCRTDVDVKVISLRDKGTLEIKDTGETMIHGIDWFSKHGIHLQKRDVTSVMENFPLLWTQYSECQI